MKTDNKTFKISTYNIEFSQRHDKILRNIKLIVKDGVSIFCLQEVSKRSNRPFIIEEIMRKLGSNWNAIYHIGNENNELGIGNGILWNKQVMKLQSSEQFQLPMNNSIAPHEWIFAKLTGGKVIPYKRRVIIGLFKFNNSLIRISSIHLDHTGGIIQRQKQLLYFVKKLKRQQNTHHEIICGDFNSIDLLRRNKELQVFQATLGADFQDATKENGWTADLYNMDTSKAPSWSKFFIDRLNIHIRRKLDYIWVKGMHTFSSKKMELEGSDHFPLVAHLSINSN